MRGCEVWDLVRVPFPYTDRPVRQRRPALVVGMPETPGSLELLWVVMVTSAVNRGWPGDLLISDHVAAGLPVASVVRVAKMTTIEAGGVEPIGRLTLDEQAQVAGTLRGFLAVALDG